MKALVTGDRGFVGSVMTERLLKLGYKVTGVDIKPPMESTYPESQYNQVMQDCRDFFKLDRTVYDVVFHFAAIVGGRATIEGNPLSVATDLAIDSDLFQWALQTDQNRLVLFSSSAAYPIALQTEKYNVRLEESHIDLNNIKSPDFTYGFCKLSLEYLASFAQKEGLRCHIFRPFSGYDGVRQDLAYPFPNLVRLAKLGSDPFPIWSDTVRDFIHMDDVCDAVLAAIEQDVQGPVNLGTGIATSFSQLAVMMADRAGYTPSSIELLSDMPAGVHTRVANPQKMLKFYVPKISLEEGVDRAFGDVAGSL